MNKATTFKQLKRNRFLNKEGIEIAIYFSNYLLS